MRFFRSRTRRANRASYFGGQKRPREEEDEEEEVREFSIKVENITCPVCLIHYCSLQGASASEYYDRTPMIVCNEGHSVCRSCLPGVQTRRGANCPLCKRALLPTPVINRGLLDVAEEFPRNRPEKKEPAPPPVAAPAPAPAPAPAYADDEEEEEEDISRYANGSEEDYVDIGIERVTASEEEDSDEEEDEGESEFSSEDYRRALTDPYARQDQPFASIRDRIDEYWRMDGNDEQEYQEEIFYDINESGMYYLDQLNLGTLLNYPPAQRNGREFWSEMLNNKLLHSQRVADGWDLYHS